MSDIWLGMFGDNPPETGEIERVEAPAWWINELAWRHHRREVERWVERVDKDPWWAALAQRPELKTGAITSAYGIPLKARDGDEVLVYRKKPPEPVNTSWRWAEEGE